MSPTTQYKHLDEKVMEETTRDRWVPSIPLPFYGGFTLFGRPRTFTCGCKDQFRSEDEYKTHYRTEQLLEMNSIFVKVRDMNTSKATFWRRATFVLQHGTTRQGQEMIDYFDEQGWPEAVDQDKINELNTHMIEFWGPLYEKYGDSAHKVELDQEDDMELEDETPEQAKADFAEPFTAVNSKGVTYYLNMKNVTLRGGKETPIWYFTKDFRPETGQRVLPDHFKVNENARNGFLTVVRIKEEKNNEHNG